VALLLAAGSFGRSISKIEIIIEGIVVVVDQ
jgi:hypothetical protein